MRFPTDVYFEKPEQADHLYFVTAESEGAVYHPTQKPVSLGRWLIRTYSRPGDIILDNACGSGSFLVGAVLERRNFIGIEKNVHAPARNGPGDDFVSIARKRIQEARLLANP